MVMRVAASSHRQSMALGVTESAPVVLLKQRGGVENLQRVNVESLKRHLPDACAHPVIRVRWNRNPALRSDHLDDLGGGRALESVWKPDSKAEQVPFRSRNLRPGDDEKSIYRGTVLAQQTALHQVSAAVASIVVSQRKTVQAALSGRGDEPFRAADSVPGKEGVDMRINLESHGAIVSKAPAEGKSRGVTVASLASTA